MSREPWCEEVTGRLCEGLALAEGSAASEHVRSCLSCFRVAADLRDLPRVRELMLASAVRPDPGEAFFATMAARTGAAWESDRVASAADKADDPRAFASRAFAWLRLPLPAALAGAVAAGLLFYVALRHGIDHVAELVPTPAVEATAAVSAGLAMGGDGEIEGTGIETLTTEDLQSLLSRTEGLVRGAPVRAEGEDDASTLSVAEAVELLSADELQAVWSELKQGSSI